jgi:hypothetical protein
MQNGRPDCAAALTSAHPAPLFDESTYIAELSGAASSRAVWLSVCDA